MSRILLAATLIFLPEFGREGARADPCPAGLGAGILVTSSDGGSSRIEPTEVPGLLRERTTFEDGQGYSMRVWWGVWPVLTLDYDGVEEYPDSSESVAYPQPPPMPEPGQQVVGLMAMVDRVGLPMPRRHDLAAGALEAVTIGGCPFQGFPLELAILDDDGARLLSLMFVPALGTALFTGYGDGETVERFEILSVASLP
jgi:hypothetical protein